MMTRMSAAACLSVFSALPAALLVWLVNPWFFDDPLGYAAVTGIPLAAIGWWLGHRLPVGKRPLPWFALSAGLYGLALVPPPQPSLSTQLLVIGIDGATWDVADSVDLPALEQLKARGRTGTLIAEEPLFSPLLWSTLATGKRPGEHGIRGLSIRSDQAKAARFWDIARNEGMSVGLYKWLVTWPPPSHTVSGFTVPGWLAGDATTHPESMSWVKAIEMSNRVHRKTVESKESLPELVFAGVFQGLRWSSLWEGVRIMALEPGLLPSEREVRLRRLRLRMDRDAFVHALHVHDPALATFSIYVTDALSHTHWEGQGGTIVEAAYRLADRVVGELVNEMGPNAHVMVISDHGFRPTQSQDSAHGVVPSIGRFREDLEAVVGPVEVVRIGRKLVVTPSGDPGGTVVDELAGLWRLQDGTPLYRVDSLEGQLGWSFSVNRAPPEAEWTNRLSNGRSVGDYLRPGRPDSAEHDERGIAVVAGPDVPNTALGTVSQLDVTPTILAIMGLPVAEDMPGVSWVGERVPRVPTHDHLAPSQGSRDVSTNEERLRALGYVD